MLVTSLNSNESITDYNYLKSGTDWQDKYENCGKGLEQSPLNLDEFLGICDNSQTFSAHYNNAESLVILERNEHFRFFNLTGQKYYVSTTEDQFLQYTSKYVIFRNPSDHKIRDQEYDVEMQVVCELSVGYESVKPNLIVSYMFASEERITLSNIEENSGYVSLY